MHIPQETVIELPYVDRKKRLTVRFVEVAILIPLGIFFLACGYAKYDETIAEQLFGFERYWRTIGWIGVAIVFILYVTLARIVLYKKGTVKIGTDKIVVSTRNGSLTYETTRMTNLTFTKDIPYETDERTDSQKASRLTFNYQGRTIDLELRTYYKSDFDQLLPISKYWRENVQDYKETYK
ncbi:MAG: hypothetical protein RIC80_10635 [Cyclobacteriaceae bacterium]